MCYSEGASTKDNAATLLKVAWMTFPLGVVITILACVFVFWWQGLHLSDPYAQAILINGIAYNCFQTFYYSCVFQSAIHYEKFANPFDMLFSFLY